MARTRQIKPEYYQDDELCRLPRDARLLFPGLWQLADRRGRLEDRPARIKALIFPYDDDLDARQVNCLLEALGTGGFIIRYTVGEKRYIQVVNFERHQNCHFREPESKIPPPPSHTEPPKRAGFEETQDLAESEASPSPAPDEPQSSPAAYGLRLTEYGILAKASGASGGKPPRVPAPKRPKVTTNGLFTAFWDAYPRKEAKSQAEKAWLKAEITPALLEKILSWLERARESEQWQDQQYIPFPATWLNQRRWEGNPPPRAGPSEKGVMETVFGRK